MFKLPVRLRCGGEYVVGPAGIVDVLFFVQKFDCI
jgi:hypothetical protein